MEGGAAIRTLSVEKHTAEEPGRQRPLAWVGCSTLRLTLRQGFQSVDLTGVFRPTPAIRRTA